MTTAPKALKYRFRRNGAAEAAAAADAPPTQAAAAAAIRRDRAQMTGGPASGGQASLLETPSDGFDPAIFRPVAQQEPPAVLSPGEETPEEEIAAIRAEGLTGRQLRLARRMSKKHGIEATSDFEAVRMLRRRGIDPFDRSALYEMDHDAPPAPVPSGVPSGTDLPAPPAAQDSATTRALARTDGAGADTRVKLPQTVKTAPPPAPALNEGQRAREIMRIQRDIVRRRRRRLVLLAARLAFFVLLPTLIAGWYYYRVATPLYATKSEFVIQKADAGAAAGLAGMFSGTQFATNQDSISVQSFLQSRDAMQKLDTDLGLRKIFSADTIDPLLRLPATASNDQLYKLYQRIVKIGYDPSEGVIHMEVSAPSSALSQKFSEALISYAENQIDTLTLRMREDQMKGARDSYDDAEAKVYDAQNKVLQLQQQVGVLDPVGENSLVMSQIGTLQVTLQQKQLELNQLLDNAQPNQARVDGVKGDIARLQQQIADQRKQLTVESAAHGNVSLANVTGQLRIAEAELETRQTLLAAAAQQLETARIEANKQVRYLETGVRPIAPDRPTYPRAFEDTLLAFLICAGIYLMLSLTASILREQVSS